jgi:membrane fusion protein (multidrug efflux system)
LEASKAVADQTKTAPTPQKPEESSAKKTGRRVLIFGVVLLLILVAVFWYWRSTFTENTDDAQVDGDIYQISSRIAGQVTAVYVTENQKVEKGALIAEIDPKDYQIALEQAQATLSSAQADYTQATVGIPITSVQTQTTTQNSSLDVSSSQSGVKQQQDQVAAAAARVDQAKANAVKSAKDVERYTPLVEKDVISRQQFDGAIAASTAANAQVVEAENNLVAQQSGVTQAQERLNNARNQAAQAAKTGPQQIQSMQAKAQSALAGVKLAQARVDQALLNLSYTRVVAPTAGIVDRKNVEVGNNLSAGQDLLTIVPLDNLWVTANFKETQLKAMQVNQHVKIEVDALGGRKFSGIVRQVGGATGSKLSLFPPENATGNFVKVVQRIPVRIDFTNLDQENKDHALRPGFSVTPVVEVK